MRGQNFLTSPQAAGDPVVAGAVTWQQAVQAVVVVVLGLALAAGLRWLLVRAIDREGDRHIGRVVGRFLGLVVAALAAVYALELLGISIGPLVGALGVGGIAIAFAAQDILQNFIAGILLQVRRPFRVGEQIRSGDHEGVVDDVNLRTTVLSTFDGLLVYLPNAQVLGHAIVNYTRTPSSRTALTVGLAYDTDLEVARQVLLEACRSTEEVLAAPPPEVWVQQFGESSIDVAVRYWHAADIASRWRVRSAVAIAVKAALDRAGMSIPFPQRVLLFGQEGRAGAAPGLLDGSR